MRKLFFYILFILNVGSCLAQDIQFSMFYAVPLYLNPAFAGSRHASRAMLHQRWQWYNQPGRFVTGFFSFDTYAMRYNSGVGGYVFNDYQSGNGIVSTSVILQYAYELRISEKYTARFGLEGGFRQLAPAPVLLPSQGSNDGFTGGATSFPPVIRPDIGTGGILYARRWWGSLAIQHLNRPNMSVIGGPDPLNIKYTLTGGYKIPLNVGDKSNPRLMALTPTFTFKRQGGNDQVDLGLYATRKWFIAGLWYRGIPFKKYDSDIQNNESVVFLIGTSYLGFGFGYAYDLTVSTQTVRTGGAHEFNLSYVFRTRRKKGPLRALPCPDFEYDIIHKSSSGTKGRKQ